MGYSQIIRNDKWKTCLTPTEPGLKNPLTMGGKRELDSLSNKTDMLLRESSLVWCHPGKDDVEQSSEVKWELFKFPLNSFLFKTFFSCTAWYLDSAFYSCWVFRGHCNMNSASGIVGFLGMLSLVFLLTEY